MEGEALLVLGCGEGDLVEATVEANSRPLPNELVAFGLWKSITGLRGPEPTEGLS